MSKYWEKSKDRELMFTIKSAENDLHFYSDGTYEVDKYGHDGYYSLWKVEDNKAYYCHKFQRNSKDEWHFWDKMEGKRYVNNNKSQDIIRKISDYMAEKALLK